MCKLETPIHHENSYNHVETASSVVNLKYKFGSLQINCKNEIRSLLLNVDELYLSSDFLTLIYLIHLVDTFIFSLFFSSYQIISPIIPTLLFSLFSILICNGFCNKCAHLKLNRQTIPNKYQYGNSYYSSE